MLSRDRKLSLDVGIVQTCFEFETMVIHISKNIQYLQRLDATNAKFIKNIKITAGLEDINCRDQTNIELVNALNARNGQLEVSVAHFDAQVPQLDDLELENIRYELKVDSLLLLNELLDTYVPSINRWNAIHSEFSTWQTMELTWSNVFSILSSCDNISVKVKDYQLLPTTIEETASSLQLRMTKIECISRQVC